MKKIVIIILFIFCSFFANTAQSRRFAVVEMSARQGSDGGFYVGKKSKPQNYNKMIAAHLFKNRSIKVAKAEPQIHIVERSNSDQNLYTELEK